MELKIVPAFDYHEEVKELFAEYMDMLLKGDPSFMEYLNLQNYDAELEHLESKYGEPEGRLYLAFMDNEVAGCIGLRKIDDTNCELKRLYVKPKFRGHKLGTVLVERLIADAKEIGYSYMLLDTLPFLQTAIKMYQDIGFYIIDRYNNSPMDTSIYMKYDLQ